jgi:hypothetical protein
MVILQTVGLLGRVISEFVKFLIEPRFTWASGVGVLLVAVVCGYELLAELACSMCLYIFGMDRQVNNLLLKIEILSL